LEREREKEERKRIKNKVPRFKPEDPKSLRNNILFLLKFSFFPHIITYLNKITGGQT